MPIAEISGRTFPHSIKQKARLNCRAPLFDAFRSGNQRLEARVPLEQFEILDPAVESEDVARALDD